jgi:hypothetical protein
VWSAGNNYDLCRQVTFDIIKIVDAVNVHIKRTEWKGLKYSICAAAMYCLVFAITSYHKSVSLSNI